MGDKMRIKTIKQIKRFAYSILALNYLLSEERRYHSGSKLTQKVLWLTRGFTSEKHVLYNFQENNYKNYLSDYHSRKASIINGKYSIILNDKILFDTILSNENVTPIIYGKIIKGQIYKDNTKINIDSFLKLVESKQKIIIKVFNGTGGNGVHRIEFVNDAYYLDDMEINSDQITKFIENLDYYLIMEHLVQADYSNKIYPGTINTIRIITMIDPKTNEIIIPIAVHKFGSDKTKPADNVWKGGMTAQVDLKTGQIKRPALHLDKNKKIEWKEFHPDTGVKIEGTIIPNWNEILNELRYIARKMDYIKYIGWDIVVTNNGIKIIEGNTCSDVNILQIHEPLLGKQEVRDFYRYYGVL